MYRPHINSVFSFSNTLEVTERTAALVLFPDPAIDFTCDFSSVVSGISANHQIAADKITTEGSSGVGSFQYELDFMVRTPQGTRFEIFSAVEFKINGRPIQLTRTVHFNAFGTSISAAVHI